LLALELRDALEHKQIRWQKPRNDPRHRDLTKDFLDAEGWAELQRFRDFLEPFYILTKTMEGNANRDGKEGGHGAVWETLKTMDYMFIAFNNAAASCRDEPESHFKRGIECGWVKLEEYYKLTDMTPVYRAALALHPTYGYDYFEEHWNGTMRKPSWFKGMKTVVSSLYDEYRRQAEVEAQAQAGLARDEDSEDRQSVINDYSSFGKRKGSSLIRQRKRSKVASELTAFQERELYPEDNDCPDPLAWWHNHRHEYPVLYKMALDLFSIPSMSSECERVFSQTKKFVTDERNRLSPETIEADQLQKHWLRNGLVS
jgi:hypothetical protein